MVLLEKQINILYNNDHVSMLKDRFPKQTQWTWIRIKLTLLKGSKAYVKENNNTFVAIQAFLSFLEVSSEHLFVTIFVRSNCA